jgi:DNA-binding winged helix-turn-helix (wHTH) protein
MRLQIFVKFFLCSMVEFLFPRGSMEFRFGQWQVVPSRRVLLQHGREVIPRAKVFDLLVYLLEHRERVVTREELLSELWGGRSIAENSLAQCIIELRKILGDDARNPRFIQTIPKAGYRIIAAVEDAEELQAPAAEPVLPPPTQPGAFRRLLWVATPVLTLAAVLVWFSVSPKKTAAHPGFREVAWWKLDGPERAVIDSSGNRQNGVAGPDVNWTTAVRRQGVSFSGFGDGIKGLGNVLPAGDSPRTVSLWMQAALPLLDYANLFEYGPTFRGETMERFILHLNYDAHVVFGPGDRHKTLIGTVRVDDGKWHLVTASYSGRPANQGDIYIDGELANSGAIGTPATDPRVEWRIGAPTWGRTTFRGTIDDVRVYSLAFKQQQASALYRCSAGKRDFEDYYFLPVGYPTAVIREQREGSSSIRNDGKDFTGIQLAQPSSDCALSALQGADAGQNLRIAVDLLVPKDAAGHVTDAGPYFRSRRAWAGDGIIGGTSAGYWVQLYSTGMVKVKGLNPWGLIAFSPVIEDFDYSAFHRLEVEAKGESLRVRLDSKLLDFEQGRKVANVVSIPPAWDGPPKLGKNDGAAGIFFGSEDNRWLVGGQQARNLRVSRLP